MTESCIFCEIVAGTAERSVVAEDGATLAFMNLSQRPDWEGHVLIVPRTHVRDIYALDGATAGAVFAMAARVARAVKRAMAPDGITILQNNEPAGGQDVFHFHVHVIPRRTGESLSFARFPPSPTPRSRLDELAARIAHVFE